MAFCQLSHPSLQFLAASPQALSAIGGCGRPSEGVAPQVPKDKAAGVAAAATAENLNRALASSGISVAAVSSMSPAAAPDTVTVPVAATVAPAAEPSVGGLGIGGRAGVGAGVLVLLVSAVAGAYWWHRSSGAYQDQITEDVRIPTRPVP